MTYFIYVRGEKIPVSKEVYQEYWHLTNREKYLNRLNIRYQVRPFSDFDEIQLASLMLDKQMDIEKLLETKQLLQLLYEALLTLNDEEFELVNDLFFKDKTLTEVAQTTKVSISTVARRRDKILKHLKKFMQ
ncbi:TPA: sigma-70 family RNA polymerase sigma factor [Streptococcus suis]|uniref:sigma factor-like helix-turn-helix DNA-binding protein n=1 Tax=Streptococcus suis TaxID=1307 RepID=UPI002A874835|nr:sigma factor-like helix-turn-helix DNA-binding protein [Streptococcus suis]MDY7594478.1 sigma factor-like helix-turn-helix DNA-binding protein [Streptococcus suis]HEL2254370.1 sigma-70 family RNA polymerase sigma factor [Streptococcus suis]HEM5039758.1 sigma-70 family RNA polymerase sigma factor [Streptococcus suis]HEM5050247.1 sigma-70 family RNA polymerase sigma factor [Streptococcus suis]